MKTFRLFLLFLFLCAHSYAQTSRQTLSRSKTIEGVVVEKVEGAQWYGIVIESRGVKYTIQLAGKSGGVKSQVGDVETVGNRVRVSYKSKGRQSDGYWLDATRVVQVRNKLRKV